MNWRIVIGADGAGLEYKDALAADLEADDRVSQVIDATADPDEDYPHVAVRGARMIAAGEADRGLFICGTGMGVAIAANKVPGIRASVAHDPFSVERLVLSNDAQVLTLGQRVIGLELARNLVHGWLGHVFDPASSSARKVEAICSYEQG